MTNQAPNRKIPKAPPAQLSGMDGTEYIYHTGDDNMTITKIERRGRLDSEYTILEPKPKPKWWQFWRWGEFDRYNRW